MPRQPLHLGHLPGCPFRSPHSGPSSDFPGCFLQKPSLFRGLAGPPPPSRWLPGVSVSLSTAHHTTCSLSWKVMSLSTQSPGTLDASSLPSPPVVNYEVSLPLPPPFPPAPSSAPPLPGSSLLLFHPCGHPESSSYLLLSSSWPSSLLPTTLQSHLPKVQTFPCHLHIHNGAQRNIIWP